MKVPARRLHALVLAQAWAQRQHQLAVRPQLHVGTPTVLLAKYDKRVALADGGAPQGNHVVGPAVGDPVVAVVVPANQQTDYKPLNNKSSTSAN